MSERVTGGDYSSEGAFRSQRERAAREMLAELLEMPHEQYMMVMEAFRTARKMNPPRDSVEPLRLNPEIVQGLQELADDHSSNRFEPRRDDGPDGGVGAKVNA